MHIAQAALAAGDFDTAGTFYRRSALLRPDDAEPVLGYAGSLAAQNRSSEAVAVLEDALPQLSGSSANRVRSKLARLLIGTHRPTEAVTVLRAALARTPDTASLLIGLGVALDASCNFPAAQVAYRKALAIEPNSVAAGNDLALSIALSGDPFAALRALQALRNRVVENGGMASDLATIDGNLALVHAMRGEMRLAREADAGATENASDLASNMRFYSALSAADGAESLPLN